MSKPNKWILVALGTLVLAAVLLMLLGWGTLTLLTFSYDQDHTDINKYASDLQQIGNAEKMMPSLDALGQHTDIQYTYRHHWNGLLFRSDGLALFVTYDRDQYEGEKQRILTQYDFLQEPIRWDDVYDLPLTDFKYHSFQMKVVPDSDYPSPGACKSFMLIGFREETGSIVYMYFYDGDIDYIAPAESNPLKEMGNLLDEAFAWIEQE